MGSKKYFEKLVEDFVAFLNKQNFEDKPAEEIPIDLRGPASQSMPDWVTWKWYAPCPIPG